MQRERDSETRRTQHGQYGCRLDSELAERDHYRDHDDPVADDLRQERRERVVHTASTRQQAANLARHEPGKPEAHEQDEEGCQDAGYVLCDPDGGGVQ